MCMYIYNDGYCDSQRPETIKEDIIVYKLFRKNHLIFCGIRIGVISPFMFKKYIFGKKYKTKIKIMPAIGATTFDIEELEIYVKSKIPIYNTYSIYEGFHCAINKDRLYKSSNNKGCDIYKVIIPKGSLIYKGIDEELIVSNQIIVTKEKC